MKFGRIKKQHGRIEGLDQLLAYLIEHCPGLSRVVPGRISRRKGIGHRHLKVQYPTEAGLKCLYGAPGTVQEVFLICSDSAVAQQWLERSGLLGE